jgi:hypothetical protein
MQTEPTGEWQKAVEARLAALEQSLDRTVQLLEEINAKVGPPRLLLSLLVRQTSVGQALLRRLSIDAKELPFPERLTAQRFGIFSQNGEDGLLLALLKEAGTTSRRFAEIGCGHNGGNSGFLAYELGWSGLMVDADSELAQTCRIKFPERVAVVETWVTAETIDGLLSTHGVTGEIDLLSIDIDGNDFWIWKAVTVASPRIVAVEYNAHFGSDRAVVVPYERDFDRHERNPAYYGASLCALARLGTEKGYRLVAVEPRGANAFFLRNDVAPHVPAVDPREVFRRSLKPSYLLGSPISPRKRSILLGTRGSVYEYAEKEQLPLIEID